MGRGAMKYATHSLPWINDYRKFVICSELTIIVNLEHWKRDMGYMENGHIFFKSQPKCMDIGLEPGNVDSCSKTRF